MVSSLGFNHGGLVLTTMERLTQDALLEAYQNGQREFSAVDLTNVQLFEVDLRQIDLQGSCLDGSYIPYGNLSLANLRAMGLS